MDAPGGRAERVSKWPLRIVRRILGSVFRARSPIVEEAGFKIPIYGVPWLLAATLVAVIALSLLLTATTSYDRDNYRYLLSAELQSVAAIFAIVLTGTFVAAQVVGTATPTMMSYLPMRAFIAAVVFNVATMAADAVALALLPQSATGIAELGVNLAVVLPVEALLFTFGYVGTALLWTRPDIHLAAVLNRIDEADDLPSHRKAVAALEELGLHAGERRHIQRCNDLIRAVVTAARILVEKPNLPVDEALQDREHPFRLLPRTLAHMGGAWAADGLDGAVSSIASALASMALEYSECDARLVDDEFPMAMIDVTRSCVRHSREIALHDFLANKHNDLIRLRRASAQRALELWAIPISDEIQTCADRQLVEAASVVVDELQLLVDAAAARQIDFHRVDGLVTSAEERFAGMADRAPMFGERTLREGLQAARGLLDQLKERGA